MQSLQIAQVTACTNDPSPGSTTCEARTMQFSSVMNPRRVPIHFQPICTWMKDIKCNINNIEIRYRCRAVYYTCLE